MRYWVDVSELRFLVFVIRDVGEILLGIGKDHKGEDTIREGLSRGEMAGSLGTDIRSHAGETNEQKSPTEA
jgi:hypothetical protein